jgi:hypothetical protein
LFGITIGGGRGKQYRFMGSAPKDESGYSVVKGMNKCNRPSLDMRIIGPIIHGDHILDNE